MVHLEDVLESAWQVVHELDVEAVRLCLLLGSMRRPLNQIISDKHELSVLGLAADHLDLVVPDLDDLGDGFSVNLRPGLGRFVSVRSIATSIGLCAEFRQECACLDD